MSKQIQAISFVAFVPRILPMGVAQQCSAAEPSNPQKHWSYRLIDGRKCWYQGENNFPKSLLRWPGNAEPRGGGAVAPSNATCAHRRRLSSDVMRLPGFATS